MRMFGAKGNPEASNLFAVIHFLEEQGGYTISQISESNLRS